MAKDPVCGMNVDEKKAAETATGGGKTYYFCSAACKASFERAPEKYAGHGGIRAMLNWKVITLSVATFTTITYVLCVAYGLVVPGRLHPAWLLEAALPGFSWLTFGSFVLGLIETFIYGAYAGVLFTAVHNFYCRRFAPVDEVARHRERAA